MNDVTLPPGSGESARRDPALREAKPVPTLEAEVEAWTGGAKWVAGVDEVGRGALAGPVVAAAVILRRIPGSASQVLESYADLAEVRDSKALGAAERCRLEGIVRHMAWAVAIGSAAASLVDLLGIGRATEVAMLRAVRALPVQPDLLLVDGYRLKLTGLPQRAILQGDAKILSIAAASIVAKVFRDAGMIALASTYPDYGFEANKGYGTSAHMSAIAVHGSTPVHRLTWAPVKFLSNARNVWSLA